MSIIHLESSCNFNLKNNAFRVKKTGIKSVGMTTTFEADVSDTFIV